MAAMRIPRRILTFWHDVRDMPSFVRHCIDNIRRLHPAPHWRIELYSDADLPSPEDRPDLWRLGPQHRADWLRAQRLAAGGGIWLDATCVLYRPVDAWQPLYTDAQVVGYAYPHIASARILENWALFIPTGSRFMAAWFAEFDAAVRQGLPEYVADVVAGEASPPPGLNLPYHAMHVAGWVVMRRHPEWKVDVRDATPLASLAKCGWAWINWSQCVQHMLHGRSLREESGYTFTKMNFSLGQEFQRMWNTEGTYGTGDIAQQLAPCGVARTTVPWLAWLVILFILIGACCT